MSLESFPPEPRIKKSEDVKNMYDLASFMNYVKDKIPKGNYELARKIEVIKEGVHLSRLTLGEALSMLDNILFEIENKKDIDN